MIVKFKYVDLLAFLVLFFSACSSSNEHGYNKKWVAEEIKSPELKANINRLTSKMHTYYAINVDSSIYYSRQLIALYRNAGMPHNEFDEYIGLCEKYNSRKHDDINALNCYAEALKIMIKNNGVENDRPYIYIDMGNMLFNNGLYSQAITSYKKSINISQSQKDNFAVSVGFNNLGIVYRNQLKYDSAIFYFRTALQKRRNMQPQLYAQSYMYMARVFLLSNKLDSMLYYIKLARQSVNKQQLLNDSLTSKTIIRDVQIIDATLMAAYFQKTQNLKQALASYSKVLEITQMSHEWVTAISTAYSIAEIYDIQSNDKQAIRYAEITYNLAVKSSNYSYALKASSMLSMLYKRKYNEDKQNYYLKRIVIYTDSIHGKENAANTHTANLLLIATSVEEALNEYSKRLTSNNQVAMFQPVEFSVLLFILIGLMILLFTLRKRKQLKGEHRKLLLSILDEKANVESLKSQSKRNLANAIDLLEPLLVSLMVKDKVFKNQNLTLSSLADMLDTNTSYLSNLINTQFKTNFNDYINSFRITEACEILKSPEANKLSIEQITDLVGFTSRRTFYLAFKKFTGVTPALYQKNFKKDESHSNLFL